MIINSESFDYKSLLDVLISQVYIEPDEAHYDNIYTYVPSTNYEVYVELLNTEGNTINSVTSTQPVLQLNEIQEAYKYITTPYADGVNTRGVYKLTSITHTDNPSEMVEFDIEGIIPNPFDTEPPP